MLFFSGIRRGGTDLPLATARLSLLGQWACCKTARLQVYTAVQDVQGIVHAKELPHVDNGQYVVDLAPLAYLKMPKNEEELRAAVKVVLGALKELHAHGFIHRDIRWPNILYTGQVGWK